VLPPLSYPPEYLFFPFVAWAALRLVIGDRPPLKERSPLSKEVAVALPQEEDRSLALALF